MLSEYGRILFTVYSLLKTPCIIDPSEKSALMQQCCKWKEKCWTHLHVYCLQGDSKAFKFLKKEKRAIMHTCWRDQRDYHVTYLMIYILYRLLLTYLWYAKCSFLFLNPESFPAGSQILMQQVHKSSQSNIHQIWLKHLYWTATMNETLIVAVQNMDIVIICEHNAAKMSFQNVCWYYTAAVVMWVKHCVPGGQFQREAEGFAWVSIPSPFSGTGMWAFVPLWLGNQPQCYVHACDCCTSLSNLSLAVSHFNFKGDSAAPWHHSAGRTSRSTSQRFLEWF